MLRWGRLEVTGGFLLLASLLWYLDRSGLVLWAAVSILLHELGHGAALKLWGGRVALIRLSGVGVELRQAAGGPQGRWAKATVALAGPLTSIAAAFGAASLAQPWGEGLYLLAGLSLGQGLFNLVPLPALDGGRALAALAGRRVSTAAALAAGVALTAAGGILLAAERNPTLLVTALWLTLPNRGGKEKKSLAIGGQI